MKYIKGFIPSLLNIKNILRKTCTLFVIAFTFTIPGTANAAADTDLKDINCTSEPDHVCCAVLAPLTDSDKMFIGYDQQAETCVYDSGWCFACEIYIKDDKIHSDCKKASISNAYDWDWTCPAEHANYATCDVEIPQSAEQDLPINEESTIYAIVYGEPECKKCPDGTPPDADNFCCPQHATCSSQTIQCDTGYHQTTTEGAIECSPCPAGSYCPNGTGAPIKCPNAWPFSDLGATNIKDCYADLGDNTGNMLKYIDCPNGTNSPSTCEQQETKNIIDDPTSPFRGYKYPGGKQNYPNIGKIECTYQGNEDTGANILNWLDLDRCPLATTASAIEKVEARPTYRIGNICYADIITDTPCGQIVTEAVPQATNGKYLTWNGTEDTRPNAHYYKSIRPGLHAKNLYTDNYCTNASNHNQLFKNAAICPPGKYCNGYTAPKKCANTNPTEYPPDGDVIAGYYSTGGAYSSTPNKSGDGCLSGYNCGQCPAGSKSPAGAASCSTCSPGEYSDTDGASTCKSCTKGYFCVNGLRNECPAGSTSDEGKSAITDCYIMGGGGGTGFCVKSKCFNIQSGVKANFSPISSN